MNLRQIISLLVITLSACTAKGIPFHLQCGIPEKLPVTPPTSSDVLLTKDVIAQFVPNSCGPTAVANTFQAMGYRAPRTCEILSTVREVNCCFGGCRTSVTEEEMMTMLATYGISSEWIDLPLPESTLLSELSNKRPVIVHVPDHTFVIVGYKRMLDGTYTYAVNDGDQVFRTYEYLINYPWDGTLFHLAASAGGDADCRSL